MWHDLWESPFSRAGLRVLSNVNISHIFATQNRQDSELRYANIPKKHGCRYNFILLSVCVITLAWTVTGEIRVWIISSANNTDQISDQTGKLRQFCVNLLTPVTEVGGKRKKETLQPGHFICSIIRLLPCSGTFLVWTVLAIIFLTYPSTMME